MLLQAVTTLLQRCRAASSASSSCVRSRITRLVQSGWKESIKIAMPALATNSIVLAAFWVTVSFFPPWSCVHRLSSPIFGLQHSIFSLRSSVFHHYSLVFGLRTLVFASRSSALDRQSSLFNPHMFDFQFSTIIFKFWFSSVKLQSWIFISNSCSSVFNILVSIFSIRAEIFSLDLQSLIFNFESTVSVFLVFNIRS